MKQTPLWPVKQKENLLKRSWVVHNIFRKAGEISLGLNFRNSAQYKLQNLSDGKMTSVTTDITHKSLPHFEFLPRSRFCHATFLYLQFFADSKNQPPLTPSVAFTELVSHVTLFCAKYFVSFLIGRMWVTCTSLIAQKAGKLSSDLHVAHDRKYNVGISLNVEQLLKRLPFVQSFS